MMIATIARFEMSGAFDLGIFTPRKWCGFCHVYLDSFKACPGLMIAHPQRTLDGALVGVLTVASIRLADRRPLNFCHCYWQSRVPYEHERCAAHGPHHATKWVLPSGCAPRIIDYDCDLRSLVGMVAHLIAIIGRLGKPCLRTCPKVQMGYAGWATTCDNYDVISPFTASSLRRRQSMKLSLAVPACFLCSLPIYAFPLV